MERRGNKTNQVQEAVFATKGELSADSIRRKATELFGSGFHNKSVRRVVGQMECIEPNGENFQLKFDPGTDGRQACEKANCHLTKNRTSGCDRYRTAGKQLSSTDVSI